MLSAETEASGSVVCLSLTYRLQPDSGAVIKVLMENKYNAVIVVGTATAPLGDIQVMDDTLVSSVYIVYELYYFCCVCVEVQYVTSICTWSDYTSNHLPPDLFLLLPIAALI